MRRTSGVALVGGGFVALAAVSLACVSVQPQRAAESRAPSATSVAVKAAIDRLSSVRPNARLRVNAVVGPGPLRSVWVAVELQSTGTKPDEFMQGASGSHRGDCRRQVGDGERDAEVRRADLPDPKLDVPFATSGILDVRVRLKSDEGTAEPLTAGAQIDATTGDLKPLMFRRSVTTGNHLQPAADPRFSRTERMRLEFPVGPGVRDGKPVSGRVIDRGGVATQVPVSVAERTEEVTGQRWITADVSLGAL